MYIAELKETGTVDTRNWEELLFLGAQEVFDMMIGVPLVRCAEGARTAGDFTAVVGLAGPINGVFAIRCDEATATQIACGMLGVDEKAAQSETWDALGEVCNMVIGNFKAKTGPAGEVSVLSVPTVIHGHDYRVRPLIKGSFVECGTECAGGVVHLRLDYMLA